MNNILKWQKVKNYNEMSRIAAKLIFNTIIKNLKIKNKINIGLATGNTMLKVYRNLADMFNNSGTNLSGMATYNLDEYVDNEGNNIYINHNLSYALYMKNNFFSLLNPNLEFKFSNIFFPDAKNPEKYDTDIADAGNLDFQLLGIGFNGHIAFNEPLPADSISIEKFKALPSRIVELNELTIKTNAKLTAGNNLLKVPQKAVTMGMATILKAEKILLLACFPEQTIPLQMIKKNMISPEIPASCLLQHKNSIIIYTSDKITLTEK
ncbi:MAG: hypothetical protein A2096_00650 [Spirochaetes bacterium GWF1_41_5]|nr:MAG: hypothetical protein A2096_00650 [Spirochaetes bacterium GWF1_41_5]